MENFASLVPLVVFVPLTGMLINLFLGKNLGEKMVGLIASLASGLAFGVAVIMAFAMIRYGYTPVVVNAPLLPQWITLPGAGIFIPWQFRVDTLSLIMMLVVTGVGTLIHIYAIGYMHGDVRFPRFFVYLNLFLAFMLILVTGNNYLMMFVGWEGVGLCSFLLIGFWFDKPRGEGWKNSNAARKAFIVNRVGDFGFLIAIFLTFWTFGTLDYYKPGELPTPGGHGTGEHAAVAGEHATTPAEGEHAAEGVAPADEHAAPPAEDAHAAPPVEGAHGAEGTTAAQPAGPAQKGIFGTAEEWLKEGNRMVPMGPYSLPFNTVLTLITLFMLIGVTGKSAQIPLFVWLPDAMAGPTPVSALIHAATMVTAGIYLVTRSNVFYHAAPLSSAIVTIIGATTALMAGFIAMGQWDIKKVLAYSTVSQLGFMVAAVGLGGYAAGMFHLVTHAFFKALLFLGSGSVIHGVEHGHHLSHDAAHGHGGGHGPAGHDEGHAVAAHHGEDSHAEHAEHANEDHGPVFDPQDMRNMGGLRHKMPITFWTYLIGTLALSGIFPLAGFWSKDEILGKAFTAGFNDGRLEGYIALGLLIPAAGFTAFYMWRQIELVFLGKPRTAAAEHTPESNNLMTIPLIILAVLSVLGGLLNLPEGFEWTGLRVDLLTRWLEHHVTFAAPGQFNALLAITALLLALGAIWLAHSIYGKSPLTKKGRDRLEALSPTTRAIFQVANGKLKWDERYGKFIEQPYNRASEWLANTLDWKFWHDYVHNTLIGGGFNGIAALLSNPIDKGIVDRGFMGIGGLVEWAGKQLRRTQTGYVRVYAFVVLLGVLGVLFMLLLQLR